MSRCMWTLLLLAIAATVLYTEGKKKSVLDYNDADVERIFREWEVRVASEFTEARRFMPNVFNRLHSCMIKILIFFQENDEDSDNSDDDDPLRGETQV